VLEASGHTFEVQASLKAPGAPTALRPDYVFYDSEEQMVANRGHELDEQPGTPVLVLLATRNAAMRRGASDALSNKNPRPGAS